MSYSDLLKSNANETNIRSYLVESNQVTIALRVPQSLRDSAKQTAELRKMSFSAFMRMCMMNELTKRGQ